MIDAEIDDNPLPTPIRTPFGALLLGAALVLMAFNLRIAVTSIGPVLPAVMRTTGLSDAGAAVLTTLPSLCFGLFGPLGPWLSRRLGIERALLLVLVILAMGTGLRGIANVPALFAGQILAGFSIGIVNVLLPSLVKRDFPKRAALMTGLYTMSLSLGGGIAAAATVPLAHAFGGSWAIALACWAVPAAIAAAIWAPQIPRATNGPRHAGFKVTGLWSDSLAWQVTLFMGLNSALAYTMFGWLPNLLQDRGLNATNAGYVLSVSVFGQAAGAFVRANTGHLLARPTCDQRCRLRVLHRRPDGLLLRAALVGVDLVGRGRIAQGGVFAIAVMLILLRAADSHIAAHLSSMVQGVGYLIASLGPFIAGLLHGWSGNWNGVALFCIAISAASALCGIGAGRDRHVRAVLSQR